MSIELFKKPKKRSKTQEQPPESEEEYAPVSVSDAEVSDDDIGAAQERLKQAKSYLSSLESEAKKSSKKRQKQVEEDDEAAGLSDFGEVDAAELDREIIANRLKKDTNVARGRAFESIAPQYATKALQQFKINSPDAFCPTGVVFGPQNIIYMITKGNCVYQYWIQPDQRSLKRLHVFKTSSDSLVSLALSSCGEYLAAGSRDGKLIIWNVRSLPPKQHAHPQFLYKPVTIFTQHRGPVLALSFRTDSHTLYSASADRTVKVWSVAPEPMYVDTLFGHQDVITSLSALAKETCLTVGSRDRTARLWKIADETQLLFRAPENAGGSQDTVAMVDEENFVSGSDAGTISLWSTRKKKPSYSAMNAHTGSIYCLAALPFTDLLASASSDGLIKIWQVLPGQELICIREIACQGIVNSMSWSADGRFLAVGLGREPRLGRWEVQKTAKNALTVFSFSEEADEVVGK